MKYLGFVKIESSNLVNYSTKMCHNDQDTKVRQPNKGKLNLIN